MSPYALLLSAFTNWLTLPATAFLPGPPAVTPPPARACLLAPLSGAARVASGGAVRVTVTFAAAPATATTRLAPTLYNKARVLHFEEDDAPRTAFTEVFPLFHGGRARNGQVLPGLRYTDGCGKARAYAGAVAVNGHNPYNNAVWLDPGPQHDPGKLVWAEAQHLLDRGWDVENHSDLHTAPDPARQVAELDRLIAARLRGYRPAVHVVPTNHAGYPAAAFAAGYLAVTSASQGDQFPMVPPYNDQRVLLSTLPVPPAPVVFRRYNADAGSGESAAAQLARLKALSDALMAPGSSASDVYLQRVFAHAIDFAVLRDWMTYTQAIARDRLWVTTLRAFEEYRRVRQAVVKTETLRGKTLTVDLNYAGVKAGIRAQHLTLLVDAPGAIASIRVTGADSSSYNAATKQINVYRSAVRPAAGALRRLPNPARK